jgi:hypothetical protein
MTGPGARSRQAADSGTGLCCLVVVAWAPFRWIIALASATAR